MSCPADRTTCTHAKVGRWVDGHGGVSWECGDCDTRFLPTPPTAPDERAADRKMTWALGLRDPLAQFAIEMERQLRENDHKRHWSTCSQRWLLARLRQETDELERALDAGANIVEEAADVANFAMMIADNAAGNTEPPQ